MPKSEFVFNFVNLRSFKLNSSPKIRIRYVIFLQDDFSSDFFHKIHDFIMTYFDWQISLKPNFLSLFLIILNFSE